MGVIQITSFLGEHNMDDQKSLPLGSLATSQNVDIDNAGMIDRRDGFALSQSFADITATFATSDEQRMFIVDGGILKFVNEDFTTFDIKSGVSTEYTKWLEVADHIFLSTGIMIDNDLNALAWRFPKPQQPVISVVGGQLPQGQYQIVTTMVDSFGREGAASDIYTIEVGDNSGLVVSPDFDAGYTAVIYVTDTDGQVLYRAVSTSRAETILDTSLLVAPIDDAQLNAGPLPDLVGSIAFYEGSIFAAEFIDGVTYIWKSKPFWWHLFDLHEDYIAIQGKVTALEGTPQGLFIGTDDEMFLYTKEEALVRIAEYGVVPGKPIAVTDEGKYFAWTQQGVCSLFPFQNETGKKVSLPTGCICSTAILEKNGYEQFIVLNNGSGSAHNKLL